MEYFPITDVLIFSWQKRQRSHFYLMVLEETAYSKKNNYCQFPGISKWILFSLSYTLTVQCLFQSKDHLFYLIRWILPPSFMFSFLLFSHLLLYLAVPHSQAMNYIPMSLCALVSFPPNFLRIERSFASSVVP